jgi:hypothetical protein
VHRPRDRHAEPGLSPRPVAARRDCAVARPGVGAKKINAQGRGIGHGRQRFSGLPEVEPALGAARPARGTRPPGAAALRGADRWRCRGSGDRGLLNDRRRLQDHVGLPDRILPALVHLLSVPVLPGEHAGRPGPGHAAVPGRGGDQRRHDLRQQLSRPVLPACRPDRSTDGPVLLGPEPRSLRHRARHRDLRERALRPRGPQLHRALARRREADAGAVRLHDADLPDRQVQRDRGCADRAGPRLPAGPAAAGAVRLCAEPRGRRDTGGARDPVQRAVQDRGRPAG